LVTIITDGRENSSKNFRADTIRDLIKQKESENWIITYVGAHGNIEEEASILALSQKKTMRFDKGSRGFDELLEKELIARKKYMKSWSAKDKTAFNKNKEAYFEE